MKNNYEYKKWREQQGDNEQPEQPGSSSGGAGEEDDPYGDEQ